MAAIIKMPNMWSVNLCFVILIAIITRCAAKNCETLDGVWYNQLGSEIILTHSSDGQLEGEYRTAVERKQGSAGTTHSRIIGAAPYNKPGAAFGFAVMWRNGSSTTAWTGQCLVCGDGNETLETSWLLRAKVDTCLDKWKSTLIGRDFFTREEQAPGPRKDDGTHSPSDGYGDAGDGNNSSESSRQVVKRDAGSQPQHICSLGGNWYNALGSEMILKHHTDNTIRGEYRTAVEREKGSAGSTHSLVYGIGNPDDPDTTWAVFVVWREGASVTGWVGQCHVCGLNDTEVVESAWLLRSKISRCTDSWKSTLYGENSFTHHEQTQDGPRKEDDTHTPGEGGEDDGSPLENDGTCSSMAAAVMAITPAVWLTVAVVTFLIQMIQQ